MKGWRTAIAVGLVFVAQTALADQAKARGSGSGGSSSGGSSKSSGSSGSHASSTAGGRHPSSSSGASPRSTGSGSKYGSSYSHSSGGSQARPRPLTPAEARHPRPGTGTGYRYPYYGHGYPYYGYGYPYYGYGYPYYGYGYGYSPWYYGAAWGLGWGWGYGYGPGVYVGYSGHRSDDYYQGEGSLRLLVEPEEAKVYVDGHYAGEVDDFDGVFQRLHVTPGRHQLTFELKGHQTHKVMVYVSPDDTLKIHYRMVKGPESQVTEESLIRPADEARERAARERYSRQGVGQQGEEAEEGDQETGTVRLEVEPGDASVYIDGEFRGAGRELRRLELPPGRHRIEIVRPGFRTSERDVAVLPGRSEDLEIRLER